MSRAVRTKKKGAKTPAARQPAPAAQIVTPARVQMFLRSRFNPLRNLTPELLSFYLDRFKLGWLREISLLWDAIAERDDKLSLVIPLRKKGVARYGYQIELVDDLDDSQKDEAEAHKQALEDFYARCSVTSAIDENVDSGVRTLIKQMMGAVGMKYSVHEIVWQPQADGSLTAQFRWVPLWFFENTTGKLRYVPVEGSVDGQDLEPGEWMVTVGEGLMVASSIAYMFKVLPLRDWVTFCERNGMPAFIGTTNAPIGSEQWNKMMEALESLASDYAALKGEADKIEALDLKGGNANHPYEPLVKRMDATMAALWRGGDLSTMSSGQHSQGRGSQRQEDEAEILLDDDVATICDTLRKQVDRFVIANIFGEGVTPLAQFSIVVPPKEATAQDISVDQSLLTWKVPLGAADAYKRYGRVPPRPGEALLQPPQQLEQLPPLGNTREGVEHGRASDAVLARLVVNAKPEIAAALAQTFRGVRLHFQNACDVPDDELDGSLQRFREALPELLLEMNVAPATVRPLADLYAPALLDGLIN